MSKTLFLRIDDFDLYNEWKDINPTVMSVYCESDKRIVPLPPQEESGEEEDEYEEEGPIQLVEYTVGARAALDRLELMGFTLSAVKEHFVEGLAEEVSALDEWRKRAATSGGDFVRLVEAKEEVFGSLTLEKWLHGFRLLQTMHVESDCRFEWWNSMADELPLYIRYMLGEGSSGMYGFPGHDCRPYLRAALEVVGLDGQLTLDLTELVYGEYVDPDTDLCCWSRRELADDFVINHKIVVLTEGKTDKFVLEGALRLLYPHLADFYSFTDFEGARASGGAGAQVNTLKAFIGAGIVNRIVAIFDNDTAAQVATRSIRDILLPVTVRVILYPDLELARNYPTLGPQGISSMDVNRLAAGIELYLGVDVLRQTDGSLTPVQWRGYDQSIRQYQGEVLNKDQLHQKFADKLRICQADPTRIAEFDWSGVKLILESIRTAFAAP